MQPGRNSPQRQMIESGTSQGRCDAQQRLAFVAFVFAVAVERMFKRLDFFRELVVCNFQLRV
jgi:hypothetical protein